VTEIDEEDFNILKLTRAQNMSPRIFINLLTIFPKVSEIINHLQSFSNNFKLPDDDQIYREIDNIKSLGAHLITYKNSLYPRLLKFTPDYPLALICLGNLELFAKNIISIVGSRNASIMGMKFASKLSTELASYGYSICSGFARGIDTSAHLAAINNTIVVMPGGIDYIYPKENNELYFQIKQSGLLVSEKPIGYKPNEIDFKTRNRIVAGISVATCVIEATDKSGSLVTAGFARDYGREVFACPGQPIDPRSHGVNKLIRDGANILTSSDDVINGVNFLDNFLKPQIKSMVNESFNAFESNLEINDNMRKIVKNSLAYNPSSLEEIHMHTRINLRFLHLILLEYELLGVVKRYKGNKFSLS